MIRSPKSIGSLGGIFVSLLALMIGFAPCSMISAQDEQPVGKSYALMIGITKYDHSLMNGKRPLKFPEDDARALGELLSKSGYNVEYLLGREATHEAILKKLEALSVKGNSDGVCVIGLFGHGIEREVIEPDGAKAVLGCFCPYDTGVRQLVNADGQKQYKSDGSPATEPVPDSLVDMLDVVNSLALAKCGSRTLIADCCREMPNRPRGRNLGLGANFSTNRLPSQTVMLFGCRPGEQALEHDDWQHGAFTKSLLDVLEQMALSPDPVTTGTLADRVKRKVQQLTMGQQNPTPVSLDSIDLNIRGSIVKQISEIPPRQKLTQAEIDARRRKAITELPNLGDPNETAYIRGRVYGPDSLKFTLEDWDRDGDKYVKELAAVFDTRTKELYREKCVKLLTFKEDHDASDYRYLKQAFYGNPDKFTLLVSFRQREVFDKVCLIRKLLATTSLKERQEVLSPLLSEKVGADKAIILCLVGDYKKAKEIRVSASHLPFAAQIPAILGNVSEAVAIAEKQDPFFRNASLLLICDALLDEGDIDAAREVFNEVDIAKIAVCYTSSFPLERFGFYQFGSVAYFGVHTYVAGRMNDEAAFQKILEATRSDPSGMSDDDEGTRSLRLSFIRGLVRDI